MRKQFLMRCTAVCTAILITLAPANASAATLLKTGSQGSQVRTIQTELKGLGFYTYSKITGYYGTVTKDAVKRFQKANKLYADGVAGTRTLNLLNKLMTNNQAAVNKTVVSTVTDGTAITGGTASTDGTVAAVSGSAITLTTDETTPKVTGALDWFSKVRYIWDRGETAVVTDVDTGKSFTVKRTYGTNHADVEPLTKEDTQIIRDIWGGFSWQRRAVTVEIGNYIIAASMTAMPHAGVESVAANRYVSNRSAGYGYGANLDAVKNNGCSGVMDIHFKNSRTHTTNIVQKSQQDMVKKAAEYLAELNA